MLNENIKEHYKGKLFEEVLNEAPIRYAMPEPQVGKQVGRAIGTLMDYFNRWRQALRAAGWTDDQILEFFQILRHLDGIRGSNMIDTWELLVRGGRLRIVTAPNGTRAYEIFNPTTNSWELWTWADNGPIGWQLGPRWRPGDGYSIPDMPGAQKYLIRPAHGIIPAGVAPILHPGLDPDNPDFNPGDYYVPDERPMPGDGGMYAGGGNYNGGGYIG